MKTKMKSTLLAFLVLIIFNIAYLVVPVTAIGSVNSTTPIVSVITAGYQDIHASPDPAAVAAKNALQQYRNFLGNEALYPDISSAASVFALILKFISFILGVAGMFFVIILGVRVVFDLLIVGLGWDPGEDEMGAIKGFVYSLSSFSKIARGEVAAGEKSYNSTAGSRFTVSKRHDVPETFGEYFKYFWVNIFVALTMGGILLTGNMYPLVSKLLGVAGVGIDTIMGLDFENIQITNNLTKTNKN